MSVIADIIAQDPVGMKQLRAVRTLGLPDWCIAAGFVRKSRVGSLTAFPAAEPADIRVLYYGQVRSLEATEQASRRRSRRSWPCPGRFATRSRHAPAEESAEAHQHVGPR